MKSLIEYHHHTYEIDWSQPLDISLLLEDKPDQVNCFYAPLFEIYPFKDGNFIGSIEKGSPVNFFNVKFNPHGNGTHTECVGHISATPYFINECLKEFVMVANVISVYPTIIDNGDRIISYESLYRILEENEQHPDALIIRTLPNDSSKQTRQYSGSNPVYFDPEAVAYIVDKGYAHLLTDLPSVDREEDGGKLLSHKAFWKYPDQIRKNSTITELIFVPNEIKDGKYLLNLQVINIKMDASLSKPVLYALTLQE